MPGKFPYIPGSGLAVRWLLVALCFTAAAVSAQTPPSSAPKTEETLELPGLPGSTPPATPSQPAAPGAPAAVQTPHAMPPTPLPNITQLPPNPTASASPVAPMPTPPVTMPTPTTPQPALPPIPTPATSNLPVVPTPAKTVENESAPRMNTIGATIMFTAEEMNTINQMLKIYDSYDPKKPTQGGPKDDFSDILTGIKTEQKEAPERQVERPLPNVYLGSIVYQSPKQWMVSINGELITSENNSTKKEFYIFAVSRKEVSLMWHPRSLGDFPQRWEQKTNNGAKLLPRVWFDAEHNAIRLDMHPNQTFVISTLAIEEGLVKPEQKFFERMKDMFDFMTKNSAKTPDSAPAAQ